MNRLRHLELIQEKLKAQILAARASSKSKKTESNAVTDKKQEVIHSLPKKTNNKPNDRRNIAVNQSAGSKPKPNSLRQEYRMEMKQEIVIEDKNPFSKSCLPKMVKLAGDSCNLLLPQLAEYPVTWNFFDKVLVYVDSGFREYVEKYYSVNGSNMMGLYQANQINRLDTLLAQELQEKIRSISQWASNS
jgi:hypothetical protein